MHHIRPVITDAVQIWHKLHQKFDRKTEMEAQAANKLLINFKHLEIETADQTIERYEQIVDKCLQQGLVISEQTKQRMLLQEVNDRYTYITKAYQHADTPYSLEKICALMRDDDAKFQEVSKTPAIGSAAFLNAVESHAEILYAQRHGGGGGGGQPRHAQSLARWKAKATC